MHNFLFLPTDMHDDSKITVDKRHFITVLERELNLSYRWEAPTSIGGGGCHLATAWSILKQV